MAIVGREPPPTPSITALYKKHLRDRLREELLPAAHAALEEVIEAAMGDLQISIEAMKDELRDKLIIQLTVDGVKKDVK